MSERQGREVTPFETLDISVPDESYVWLSDYFARILVSPPAMHAKFQERLIGRLHAGLIGRGKAGIDSDGYLRIVFAVTKDERDEGELLERYKAELLHVLHLGEDAIEYAAIDELKVSAETEERVRQSLMALGLRAVDATSLDATDTYKD